MPGEAGYAEWMDAFWYNWLSCKSSVGGSVVETAGQTSTQNTACLMIGTEFSPIMVSSVTNVNLQRRGFCYSTGTEW